MRFTYDGTVARERKVAEIWNHRDDPGFIE
jgi:hypothetical protein